VRALVVAAALAGVAAGVRADEWTAPAEERARTSPVPDSPEAVAKGRALFQRHCTACHGPKGKGDGPASTEARDLTDPAVQDRLTDGEIFWKVGTGRKKHGETVMPAFARQIGTEDRWKLVRYVRSLRASPATPASPLGPSPSPTTTP
jgi:mono/diheme cytochrome c family protein